MGMVLRVPSKQYKRFVEVCGRSYRVLINRQGVVFIDESEEREKCDGGSRRLVFGHTNVSSSGNKRKLFLVNK